MNGKIYAAIGASSVVILVAAADVICDRVVYDIALNQTASQKMNEAVAQNPACDFRSIGQKPISYDARGRSFVGDAVTFFRDMLPPKAKIRYHIRSTTDYGNAWSIYAHTGDLTVHASVAGIALDKTKFGNYTLHLKGEDMVTGDVYKDYSPAPPNCRAALLRHLGISTSSELSKR
jgi:hypothetical protein